MNCKEILGLKVIAIDKGKSSDSELEVIFTNPDYPDRPMYLTGMEASDLIAFILNSLEHAEERES